MKTRFASSLLFAPTLLAAAACTEPEVVIGDADQKPFRVITRDVRTLDAALPNCPGLDGCGVEPPRYACPGGAVGNVADRCVLLPTATCAWSVKSCEPEICAPSECSRAIWADDDLWNPEQAWPPAPSFSCDDGRPGGWTDRCIRALSGPCAWETIDCNPLTR